MLDQFLKFAALVVAVVLVNVFMSSGAGIGWSIITGALLIFVAFWLVSAYSE
jgi:hypothetical protein